MIASPLSWVEVDKKALLHNLFALKRHVGSGMDLMPVVKSNAYGHGLEGVAKIFQDHVSTLCVASLSEALFLREKNVRIPILVLSYYDARDIEALEQGIRKDIEFVVYTKTMVALLSRIAAKCKKKVSVHLKIDTGTARVGVLPANFSSFHRFILSHHNLSLKSCWTHLACAENPADSYNTFQLDLFWKTVHSLQKKNASLEYHVGASALLLWHNEGIGTSGRPGIILYGLWPSGEIRQWVHRKYPSLSFQEALTWKTRIIQLKNIPSGSFVSYDRTFRVHRKTRLAVLPVGYYEGYDRALSSKASVLIRGRRACVLGRVCMNLMMVDATAIPSVREGDEVVLLGTMGKERISAEELAEKASTIAYEIVARIHPGIPRLYV